MFWTEYDSLKKKKKKFFSVSLYSVHNIAIHRIRLIFDSSNTLVYRLGPIEHKVDLQIKYQGQGE